jgi:hypothetical protein
MHRLYHEVTSYSVAAQHAGIHSITARNEQISREIGSATQIRRGERNFNAIHVHFPLTRNCVYQIFRSSGKPTAVVRFLSDFLWPFT